MWLNINLITGTPCFWYEMLQMVTKNILLCLQRNTLGREDTVINSNAVATWFYHIQYDNIFIHYNRAMEK